MPISTRATSDRRAHEAGFTLIELALVLLILGILAGIALPSLSRLGQAHVDGEARRLAATISYLHDEAALRGRIYRLTLDLDEPHYAIEVADAKSGSFVSPRSADGWDPYAPERRDLPHGVRISAVQTASRSVSSGTSAVYFLPEDARESVTIVLDGESGTQRRLDADGVTGRVTILREDLPR